MKQINHDKVEAMQTKSYAYAACWWLPHSHYLLALLLVSIQSKRCIRIQSGFHEPCRDYPASLQFSAGAQRCADAIEHDYMDKAMTTFLAEHAVRACLIHLTRQHHDLLMASEKDAVWADSKPYVLGAFMGAV